MTDLAFLIDGCDAAFANGDLRVPRSRRHGLCSPASGQPGVAGQDRLPLQAPGRATAAGGAPLLCQLSLPSRLMDKAPRVVAKVEWHPGELYPRVGFIVTNLARTVERLVAFYNHRGTCEQYIKEGKGSSGPACHADPSPPTPSASWPTISAISCGRWRCRRRRSRGP
jgi:hypothetical protein